MKSTRRQVYTVRKCDHCGKIFQASRSHAKFCGAACRKANWRERASHNDSKKRQPLPKIEVVGEGREHIRTIKTDDLYRLIRAIGGDEL